MTHARTGRIDQVTPGDISIHTPSITLQYQGAMGTGPDPLSAVAPVRDEARRYTAQYVAAAQRMWKQEDGTGLFPITNMVYFDQNPARMAVHAFLIAVGQHARGFMADLSSIVNIYTNGAQTLTTALHSMGDEARSVVHRRNRCKEPQTRSEYDMMVYTTLNRQDRAVSPEALNKLNFLYMATVLAQRALF